MIRIFITCIITQCMLVTIATVGAPMRPNSAQIGTTPVQSTETSFDKKKRAYVNNLLRLWQRLCFRDDRTWLKRREAAKQQENKITESFIVIGLPFLHLQNCLWRQDESGKTWIQHLNGLLIIKSLKVKGKTSFKNNKRYLNSGKKKDFQMCVFVSEKSC